MNPPNDTVMHYLADDHDRLDGLLGEVARHVAVGDFRAAAPTFATFAAGLTRHIRLEDELLFPRFEQETGMASGPTTVMRREHRLIEEILTRLGDALRSGDPVGFAAIHTDLLEVLGPHNEKEEAVVYPMTDEALDDEARDRLVAELRRFPWSGDDRIASSAR